MGTFVPQHYMYYYCVASQFVTDFFYYNFYYLFVGGGKRDRTADLLHAMQALSQLSYTPRCEETKLCNTHLQIAIVFFQITYFFYK
jgi:hypothetical protein